VSMHAEDDYEDDLENETSAPTTRLKFWTAVFTGALSLWIFVLLVVLAEHM
jgi:hypothetical protein